MKALLLDIETAPNIAYIWGLFKENVPLARLIDSGYVLCWSAKWLGEEGVMFDSIQQSSPKRMLKKIHSLLDEADAVVHYNGTKFDIPTLNKEFLLYGMEPPAPYKQIDLLKTARGNFKFPSNKLDYIAQALGLGKKHETNFQLWINCMNKDPEAWEQMREYNINDVVLLEQVYYKLRPWVKNHPNLGLYLEERVCPVCGDYHYIKKGFAYTHAGKYQRYKCKACGHWFRDNKNIQTGEKFVNV